MGKKKDLKEQKEAALKDIQKRYEADGQSAAVKLSYLKYGALGETSFCCGCETDTLFILDQCSVCGGALPKDSTVKPTAVREFFIKFVADDDYTHFAKLSHATKDAKQLDKDWDKSVKQAKKKFDWGHNDVLILMQDKGWKHEIVDTVQLDY
jgi:hypothetical protein